MSKIVCFSSPKGGCGATFVCGGVAFYLAALGHRVLAVDMCFEKGTLDYILGFQNDYIYTLEDVEDGLCSLAEAVVCRDDLSYIKYGYEFEDREFELLSDAFKDSGFDYILIDIPPYIKELKEQISAFADELILVTEPDHMSQRVCDVFMTNLDFDNVSIIINKIKPSFVRNKIQMTADEILDTVSLPPMGFIPWSPYCDIVLKTGIFDTDMGIELSTAFTNIAMRLEGKRVPAMDFGKVYDFFKSTKIIMKGRKKYEHCIDSP